MGNNSSEIRKIDQLGRIVLPKHIREALTVGVGDSLSVKLEENKIILEVFEESCIFCKSTENLFEFKGHKVCEACKNEIVI